MSQKSIHLRRLTRILAVLSFTAAPIYSAALDFDAEVQSASKAIANVMRACDAQMNAGDFKGANAKLLATFPEATRTPAQSFVLANVLFEIDPKKSYALHKVVAQAEPQNATVMWEWALEQHRAGEYAAALVAYDRFSKAHPGYAPTYALQADCHLRLNQVDEAIDAWRKSEQAPSGTLETMENLVCAVHREPMPHERRANLLAKATTQHDADAAAELIALDCDFPRDWWNAGPHKAYLKHDLPAVTAALNLPADDPRMRAMACAAECVIADIEDAEQVRKILTKYRFVIDADHTIPAHGGLLDVVLGIATRSKVLDSAMLREKFGPRILELARKSSDERIWNWAIYTTPIEKPENFLELERAAWKATGDARYAAGALFSKNSITPLTSDDPDLAAALKQFPENGSVQRAAYEIARREGKVTQKLLADAARAEFTHFSSFVAPATVIDRPRSGYLRGYFAEMQRIQAAKKPEAP